MQVHECLLDFFTEASREALYFLNGKLKYSCLLSNESKMLLILKLNKNFNVHYV